VQQPGCALHRAPAVKPSTFNAGGAPVHGVWNFETLPRRSLEVPSLSLTAGRSGIASLPLPLPLALPHDPQGLPYGVTTNLLPTLSDTGLASPKPWYSQVELLTNFTEAVAVTRQDK